MFIIIVLYAMKSVVLDISKCVITLMDLILKHVLLSS